MYNQDFNTIILSILSVWAVFLLFHRLIHSYRQKHTWKRDIILTFIQAVVVVLIIAPILDNFR
ncbi:hypothetical protein GCM10008967_32250 [Bacillus carboniphilus]|uniref:Uncharacterized protein n=1 Tax=Bacillus carboniphilus TaxID=86663 RepID=A0ABP3GA19_9BACI